MKALKVKITDRVVVYNVTGNINAARVYWMFKAFGHQNVSILNGGFKKWKEEKRPIERDEEDSKEEDYAYTFNPEIYRTIE